MIFSPKVLHQRHVFMNTGTFMQVPEVSLPQENILTVQLHTGVIIFHLISKFSNLELKSDRKKFYFLFFSMPVASIS